MFTLFLYSLFVVDLVTGLQHDGGGQARVQLGSTVLTGKRFGPSNVEFFGGPVILPHHVPSRSSSPTRFQVSLLPSLLSASSAFLIRSSNILFSLCNHSMPVVTVNHAYSPYSPLVSHSFPRELILLSTAIGCGYVGGLSHP